LILIFDKDKKNVPLFNFVILTCYK
jgi:hypothetical protein